jgi:hypothetical protein
MQRGAREIPTTACFVPTRGILMSMHDAEYLRQRRQAHGIPAPDPFSAPRFQQRAIELQRLEQLPWPRNLFGGPASIAELMAESAHAGQNGDGACWPKPICGRPPSRKVFCSVLIRSLRPYVRPVDALAHERWPRWFPRQGLQTTVRPQRGGHWVYRSVPCRGSIDHTICSSSCKFWYRLSTVAVFSCSPCLANLYAATADFAL